MASKRSAFSVYQELKQNQENMESDDGGEKESQESSDQVELTHKGSRKRKRFSAMKNKKKRKIEEPIQSDEAVSETKKPKKSKDRPQKSGKVKKVSSKDKQSKERVAVKRKKVLQSSDSETVSEGVELDNSTQVNADKSFYSQFNPDSFEDSRDAALDLFTLLINPVSPEQFFGDLWEKKPLVIHRHNEGYNNGWFSTQQLDSILRENDLEFGTNIDLTTYQGGERETHNPVGRAHPSTVWESFQNGCSVRLLNPATYSKSVWLLNSTLQEHFNSCVGANIYLTPANSQGFAPHYDDIEAFVLQLEGRKHWKVYAPSSTEKLLPLHSSGNFTSGDDLGHLVIDTILEPGDLLYFPRGFIHQAHTLPESHSLHITVSTYQKNTWGDLLEKILPAALQTAIEEDVEFRQGLPLTYPHYMGLVNSDKNDLRRSDFCEKVAGLLTKLVSYAPVEQAADQVALEMIHSSLPPVLTEDECSQSIVELGSKWNSDGIVDGIELAPDSQVRLIRYGAVRIAMEGEDITLYYTVQNSRLYKEKDLIGMQIHQDDAPAVDCLINKYPEYVRISDLPLENGTANDKVALCMTLFKEGLLVVNY